MRFSGGKHTSRRVGGENATQAASSLVLPRVMPGCALQPTDFADRVEVVVWSELACSSKSRVRFKRAPLLEKD